MHELLSQDRLSELPASIRDVAVLACKGSLVDLQRLYRLICEYPSQKEHFKCCLCVFHANLNPSGIPHDGKLPGDAGTMAIISLRCLNRLTFPSSLAVDFWPRMWIWMHYIYSNPDHFPPEPTGIDICTNLLLLVGAMVHDDGAAKLIDETIGVRILLTRAWARMFPHRNAQSDTQTMGALCWVLRRLDLTKSPAHLEEAIDGAGGSLDDFARLITRYINFVVPTSKVILSQDDYTRLDAIFYALRGCDDYRDALLRAGYASALARMMCALAWFSGQRSWARDSSERLTSDDDLMGAALLSLFSLFKAPHQNATFRQAISGGLLRAIVSYGIQGAEVVGTTELLTDELPAATLYYSVISRMESALRDVKELIDHPAFATCAIHQVWTNFCSLAKRRIGLAKLLESSNSQLRACDNMECGEFHKKEGLKCCASCHEFYYCSRLCQRADWVSGHRENCAKIRTFRLEHPNPLSSRDKSFLRELLHRDYVANLHRILCLQVTFVRELPSEAFAIIFDYDTGTANIFIARIVSAYANIDRAQHISRSSRSGGRMELHVAPGMEGILFPMRSNSSILHDGVRLLAQRNLPSGELSREVQMLIERAKGTLVQIHH